MSLKGSATIIGLEPIEPKRTFILPCRDKPVILYVVDGVATSGIDNREVVHVSFGRWERSFANSDLVLPVDSPADESGWVVQQPVEVLFRISERDDTVLWGTPDPEVVAISFDHCQTYFKEKYCNIRNGYERD